MASLFNRPFPDWLTRLLVPVLAGIVIGALTGAFVYPRLVMSFDPTVNERLASFDPPAKEQALGKIGSEKVSGMLCRKPLTIRAS